MIYSPKPSTLISNVFLATETTAESILDSREGHRECIILRFDGERTIIRFIDGREIRPSMGSVCIIPARQK